MKGFIVKYLWGLAHVLRVKFKCHRITLAGIVSQIAQDPWCFQQVPLPLSARCSWTCSNKTHQENIVGGHSISSPLQAKKKVKGREIQTTAKKKIEKPMDKENEKKLQQQQQQQWQWSKNKTHLTQSRPSRPSHFAPQRSSHVWSIHWAAWARARWSRPRRWRSTWRVLAEHCWGGGTHAEASQARIWVRMWYEVRWIYGNGSVMSVKHRFGSCI